MASSRVNGPGSPGCAHRPYPPSHAHVPPGVAAALADTPLRVVRDALLAGDVGHATIKGVTYVDLDSLESFLQRRAAR